MTNKVTITPSLQDYLEAILNLSEDSKKVRITDIATELDVAKSSVHQAVTQLEKAKLVVHERYGPLELTDKGRKEALKVRDKHDILVKFFTQVLGVDYKTADNDACLIEHVISQITIEKLTKFFEDYIK
ncbi:MAG: metal-dependent transcriptional regulator [Clostridiales bacterium]|nr:metal-dependent transcriptional regulator [Clostridiales bacterium]